MHQGHFIVTLTYSFPHSSYSTQENLKKKSAIYVQIVALQNTNYSSCPEQTTVFSYCNLQKDKIVG